MKKPLIVHVLQLAAEHHPELIPTEDFYLQVPSWQLVTHAELCASITALSTSGPGVEDLAYLLPRTTTHTHTWKFDNLSHALKAVLLIHEVKLHNDLISHRLSTVEESIIEYGTEFRLSFV